MKQLEPRGANESGPFGGAQGFQGLTCCLEFRCIHFQGMSHGADTSNVQRRAAGRFAARCHVQNQSSCGGGESSVLYVLPRQ